jgi:putative ABC transport system permease protein
MNAQLLLDVGQQAWLSLGDRKLRTALCIAGIAIGITAVTLIGVVTQGGKQIVFSELQTFGSRSVWIYRDSQVTDPYRIARSGTGIDNDDLDAVRESGCCSAITRLTPLVFGGNDAPKRARAGRRYSGISVQGVGADYLDINNDRTSSGRGFNAIDIERARHVAIIGEKARQDLFDAQDNPVGREIRLGNEGFEVIGVLVAKDRSLLASMGADDGQSSNDRVLIPYRRLQAMTNTDQIDMLQAEVSEGMPAADVAQQVAQFLDQRHHGAFGYATEAMEKYEQTAQNILGGLSTIGTVAASVSLFVAALGVLNIMSTSVLERTREIGVRKALGGTQGEILLQFLLEASLISGAGGVIGLVLGGTVSVVIARLTGFPMIPSVSLIVLGLVIAVLVGLVSGLYPAWRAARLRPVEALRYE